MGRKDEKVLFRIYKGRSLSLISGMTFRTIREKKMEYPDTLSLLSMYIEGIPFPENIP